MQNIYRILTEIQNRRENAAICIITETHGSTPLKAGAKMIVWDHKKIAGTIGGGNLEHKVIEDALSVIKKNKAQTFEHHLVQDHQMCCGGSVKIFIEPVMNPKNLYVFGAGHIAKEIIRYATPLDFQIHIIDERVDMIQSLENKDSIVFPLNHKDFLPRLAFNENAYIVICTHLHQYDREILAYCIQKPFAYLGMIGSKRKVAVTKKIFLTKKLATETELHKVDMPMGFDIGGTSPSEIALSIVAKLVEVKNHQRSITSIHSKTDVNHNDIKEIINYVEADSINNGCW